MTGSGTVELHCSGCDSRLRPGGWPKGFVKHWTRCHAECGPLCPGCGDGWDFHRPVPTVHAVGAFWAHVIYPWDPAHPTGTGDPIVGPNIYENRKEVA